MKPVEMAEIYGWIPITQARYAEGLIPEDLYERLDLAYSALKDIQNEVERYLYPEAPHV